MKFVKAIEGPVIFTRWEPIDDADWEAYDAPDAIRDEDFEPFGAWVAFYVIQKKSAAGFVHELGRDLEEIAGDLFSISTIAGARYAYVIASAEIQDLDANLALEDDFEALSTRLLDACRKLGDDYVCCGCSYFGPRAFLKHDRRRAAELLQRHLEIDIVNLK